MNPLFKGKTIRRVDMSTCNLWTFYFTDGTRVEIEAVMIGGFLYGMEAHKV